jgi:arylformamidase
MSAPSEARIVWRGYTQAALDAQYDQQAQVPDPTPWFEAWRAGSERARVRTQEVREGISYGSTESERLDLYLPTDRPRSLPFAAFVHGGAWQWSMRADAGYSAKAIHHHGAAFVAIGFDAVPKVDLERQVDQVRRAWRFLLSHGPRLGLDPSRGHLLAHASGAHLAALAAFDPRAPHAPASAVLLSGIYDLEPVRRSACNEVLGLDRESAERLSPSRLLPRTGPPLVVACGDADPEEIRRQSLEFAQAAIRRGLDVSHAELPGRNHFDTSLELANPHSEVLAPLRRRW